MSWLKNPFSSKKSGEKTYYWLILSFDGKLQRKDAEGPDKGTRSPPSAETMKVLKSDPKAHISIKEINGYYFDSSVDRETFFKLIENRTATPNSIERKAPTANQASSKLNSSKPISPTAEDDFELGSIKKSKKRKEDRDAEKTMSLNNNEVSGLTVSDVTEVYRFEIVEKKWALLKISLRKLPSNMRAEISEGEQSDLKRAESGDLRSAELLTIYFASRNAASLVFTAYVEKAKERRTNPG
jgi:hypothetical protein